MEKSSWKLCPYWLVYKGRAPGQDTCWEACCSFSCSPQSIWQSEWLMYSTHLFLTLWASGNPKIKTPVNHESSEGRMLFSQHAVVFSHGRGQRGINSFNYFFNTRMLIPFMKAGASRLDYLLMAPIHEYSVGGSTSTWTLGRHFPITDGWRQVSEITERVLFQTYWVRKAQSPLPRDFRKTQVDPELYRVLQSIIYWRVTDRKMVLVDSKKR